MPEKAPAASGRLVFCSFLWFNKKAINYITNKQNMRYNLVCGKIRDTFQKVATAITVSVLSNLFLSCLACDITTLTRLFRKIRAKNVISQTRQDKKGAMKQQGCRQARAGQHSDAFLRSSFFLHASPSPATPLLPFFQVRFPAGCFLPYNTSICFTSE